VVNYHTVLFALFRRGRVQRGETVLVMGAGGGIGTAAVQVALGSAPGSWPASPTRTRWPRHGPPVPPTSSSWTVALRRGSAS
jgi:hypothetical protein